MGGRHEEDGVAEAIEAVLAGRPVMPGDSIVGGFSWSRIRGRDGRL